MNAEKNIDTAPQPSHVALPPPNETLWSSLRALPRAVWVLFFGTFLNKFGTFVVPFLTLYLTRQGYTVGQTGLAIGAYGAGNLAASLLGGHLADYLGRRKTIVLSMFSGAIMMLLLSQAHDYPVILAFTLLAGLTNESYRPASTALLADLVLPHRRITAISTLRMAYNAGFAFGPATAGFLAAYGFGWLFAGDAATSALYGFVALLLLPRILSTSQNIVGWGHALEVVRRDHKLHQLLLANLATGILFCQPISTLGLYVTHQGFSGAVYGVVLSLNGALIVMVELPLTTFTRKFPARRAMAVGYTLIGTGFCLNAFAHTVPALVLCMIIFTVGEMVAIPTSAAYLVNLAPPDMRGRYLGVSGLAWSTAAIIGPGLGMKLFTAAPGTYWISCAALGLFAATIISIPNPKYVPIPEPMK